MKWGPLTVVEWIDSCSIRGGHWHPHEDAQQLSVDEIKSVGWILKEDKKAIVLVPHAAAHSVGGEICIPKVAITRRWTLAKPRRRKNPDRGTK